MKNVVKYLILFALVLTFTNCKKDWEKYPSDIPNWLKSKIKGYGKTGGCLYHTATTLTINEYKNNNNDSIIYAFEGYTNHGQIIYYDYSGNMFCNYYLSLMVYSCGYYIKDHYNYSRNIWAQNRKYCNY
jgi:hypothetical protein